MAVETIQVTGMSCAHCVRAVTNALTALDGVTTVGVDLASGAVTIESAGPVDDTAIAAAIDDAIGQPGAITQLPVTPARLRALLKERSS